MILYSIVFIHKNETSQCKDQFVLRETNLNPEY